MRALIMLIPLAFFGCDEPGDNGNNGNNGNNGDDPFDWSGSYNGSDPLPSGTADQVLYGDITGGYTGSLDAWSVANYGWPASNHDEFSGAHVWHDVPQGSGRDIYVQMTPETGVDLNLYLMQRVGGDTTKPPDAVRSNSGDFFAMFGRQAANPGQPEVLCVYGFNDVTYSVLVGVAGSHGITAGEYKLEVWDRPGTGCQNPG